MLETIEVPRPEPRAGHVVVRLGATSVNPVDCKLRSGAVTFLGEPPFTLGFDLSGTVVDVGDGVTEFRSGDEVFGMVHSRTGTYSEYVLARAGSLAPRPANVDHHTAAALPTAALTARQALDLAKVVAGERVLIHAAAGGVGHLAVQLAVLRGARVICTARAANHEFLRDLGADEVIDYTATDFTTAVRDVDVVLDLVGGDYGSRSLRVLRPDGRYVTAQQSDAGEDPRVALVTGAPSPAQLAEIGELVGAGRVRVHIDQAIPLAQAGKAHELSESGRVRGKLVLTPW
ncbi:2-haloacrylate reductase [Nocardia sp. RB56]|uniref:2-haloacrylate reductase n=1 Tax=Nocardia aurantia TaxID=2585199 RepID=A0A7K0DNR1_9NOCA|nr:2-haloacrylate reductase [Nocardia aurantia]